MTLGAKGLEEAADEELVNTFRITGDQACFLALFERHRRRIYGACHRFFQQPDAAEEATQETFVRVFRSLDRFTPGDFVGWVMRIARNVCIDLWRRQRHEVGLEGVMEAESTVEVSPERATDLRLAVARVREEIRLLPAAQRECLELKIEGYSYEETAARTGLPVEAVKSHIQNGRRMLWLKMQGMLAELK